MKTIGLEPVELNDDELAAVSGGNPVNVQVNENQQIGDYSPNAYNTKSNSGNISVINT